MSNTIFGTTITVELLVSPYCLRSGLILVGLFLMREGR